VKAVCIAPALSSALLSALLSAGFAVAQAPDEVLVIANRRAALSMPVASYYMRKRSIPRANLCVISTDAKEEITREVYDREIEKPIADCLGKGGLEERVLYIVTTLGVPLKVAGDGSGIQNDAASVDSELTLLYSRLHGKTIPLAGPARNPFFQQRGTPFRHPLFPIYLVTRLAAQDLHDSEALVDRGLAARNEGVFVIDARADNNTPGNDWLRTAALLLPKGRVVLDDSAKVLTNVRDVIGYASWGSNDPDRKHRFLHMHWLPGAIVTEFVSTDGRSLGRPPDNWELGNWKDPATWFAGAPQTLATDYIHEGASGASGQVYEPYLSGCPRPDYVLPAYASGRTLAESYYVGTPVLSWMTVILGDPLTRLRP
jgi:uncharacterized protein (TIGR03790 family)